MRGYDVWKHRIVAAAIKVDDEVWSVPAPGRHHDVIARIHRETPGVSRYKHGNTQGFLKDSGRFVDRVEAAEIAIESGQIKELRWPPLLYTEDLW